MSYNSRPRHLVALLASLICWSVVPIFIHYLNQHLGNFTQNLYRYIAACALLWTLSLVFFRRHLNVGQHGLLRLLAPAAVICCHQLLWVESIKLTTPTTAMLLSQVQVVVVGLLAWVFFTEERSTILNRRFLAGAALSLVGVAGFVVASGNKISVAWLGYLVILGTAVCWATYTVVAKAATRKLHPVVSFTYVCTGVLIFFVLTTPWVGNPGKVLTVPPKVLAALAVSGVVGIGLAHLFFYKALSGLGAAVCGTGVLLIPLLTGTWSYLIFHETLRPLQLVFGAVLLAGAGLIAAGRRNGSDK